MDKRYFVKAVDKRPILENNLRPEWTDMGDGQSYFITSNPVVADGLRKLVDKGKGGLIEVTREELTEKKTVAAQRQKEVDARRQREDPFRNPGLAKQSVRGQHQTAVSQTEVATRSLSAEKAAVVARGRNASTIDREPSVDQFAKKGQTPVVDVDKPVATKPSEVAAEPVPSGESPPY